MPAVNIPNVGQVNFPDSMSQAEITQAIQTQILPKYAAAHPQPSTLMDKVKALSTFSVKPVEAALQGAAQGAANLGTSVYNAVNSAEGLPQSNRISAPNLEGQAAQAHPVIAGLGSIAPYLALPGGAVDEGAGIAARIADNAVTGSAYGGLGANQNPNATPQDVLKGAAGGALAGASVPEAASVLFKGGKLIASPIAMALNRIQKSAERDQIQNIPDRSATPQEAQQNLSNMQQMGVTNPTLGTVTNNPTAGALTEYSTLAPMTGQKQVLKQTLAQTDRAAQHVYNDMMGGRNYLTLEPGITKEISDLTDDNQGFSAAQYDALSNVVPMTPGASSITKENAQQFAQKSLDDIENSQKGNLLTNRITDPTILEQLNRTSKAYELDRPVQLADLIADRSEIGKEIGNETIPSTQTPVLKGTYGAFTKDIESNLDHVVPPEAKEQWANDFTDKVSALMATANNPENAIKLQADAMAIKNNILGNDKATLKDIWQAANNWHRENVGPLQGDDIKYHTYQGVGKNIANTLLKEQNLKAFNVLNPSLKKAVLAARLKGAVNDVQPGEEGTEQGVVNAARLSRQYTTANVKQGIDEQLDGLSSMTSGGTRIPLKTALKNIVNLNNSVKDLRPLIKSPLTGYSLKGGLGSGMAAIAGGITGGPLGAAAAVAGTSVMGRLVGNLMRNPKLIKAYINPQERMQYILKILPGANRLNQVGQFIDRQNIAAPAAYMTGQPSQQ